MSRIVARTQVLRIVAGESRGRREDSLAVEEPLEIRVAGSPLSITMRTPGSDFDLAAGFLVSEGVISHDEQLSAIRYCAGEAPDGGNTYNVLDVTLGAEACPLPDPSLDAQLLHDQLVRAVRQGERSTRCAPCSVYSGSRAIRLDRHLTPSCSPSFPDRLRAGQDVFEKTGGLHAAALFDAEPPANCSCCAKTWGRHNAVDKVVGWALTNDRLLPLRRHRAHGVGPGEFRARPEGVDGGHPACSPPSRHRRRSPSNSRTEIGMTVVGFLRGPSMVVYSADERIVNDPGHPEPGAERAERAGRAGRAGALAPGLEKAGVL